MEDRLLRAYAGHATAAIERAVLMDDAQRSHQVATALLELARSLAAATTVDDVCHQLSEAVPDVVGCDVGSVWLWDESAMCFRLQSWTDTWSTPPRHEVHVTELGGFADLAANPRPIRVTIEEAEDFGAMILEEWGIQDAYAAPIQLRGAFLGVVTAGMTTPTLAGPRQQQVLEHLGALAGHTSTALDSSMLLEQIRHQALHDALTGLPNRSLAEARAARRSSTPSGAATPSRCCSSTSTGSRTSTTRSATLPATSSSARSVPGSNHACARRTRSPDSAATSTS